MGAVSTTEASSWNITLLPEALDAFVLCNRPSTLYLDLLTAVGRHVVSFDNWELPLPQSCMTIQEALMQAIEQS